MFASHPAVVCCCRCCLLTGPCPAYVSPFLLTSSHPASPLQKVTLRRSHPPPICLHGDPTRFFSSSLHLVSDCDRGGLRLAPFSETSRSRQWKERGRPQGRALGSRATDLHRGMTAGSEGHVACLAEPVMVPKVVQTPRCSPHTFSLSRKSFFSDRCR